MTFIGKQDLLDIGERVAARAGTNPPPVYDIRIDAEALRGNEDPSLRRFVQHQALMRSYQGRYVLLPSAAPSGSILSPLQKHYDAREMLRLDELRANLEDELVGPPVAEARSLGHRQDCAGYVANLIPNLKANRPSGFLEFLDSSSNRDHYYRNFLLQSSVDLLAEASASALGVIGEYGEPQSALFRILIDEFGYADAGAAQRHPFHVPEPSQSVSSNWLPPLCRSKLPAIHGGALPISPALPSRRRRALLWRTCAHRHPPFRNGCRRGGRALGVQVRSRGQLTRLAFERSGDHLLAVTLAFEAAVKAGHAEFGMPTNLASPGRCAVPATNWNTGSALQIGGIGFLTDPSAFKVFPPLSVGREVVP